MRGKGKAVESALGQALDRPGHSSRSLAKGSDQSPGLACRKSRMEGYQGLSDRFSIQRQSGVAESSSHVGLPSAPARWATAVSIVMIRSSCSISVAVEAKSSINGDKSAIFLHTGPAGIVRRVA